MTNVNHVIRARSRSKKSILISADVSIGHLMTPASGLQNPSYGSLDAGYADSYQIHTQH